MSNNDISLPPFQKVFSNNIICGIKFWKEIGFLGNYSGRVWQKSVKYETRAGSTSSRIRRTYKGRLWLLKYSVSNILISKESKRNFW